MKKSKILLVTVLALVLCLLCVTTSTFSWLPRPKNEKGNALVWSPSYEISVGKDISMQTFELTEDGKEPETPQEVVSFSNSEGLAPEGRKYYRTDIANSGTDAQSVSLYLSSLNLAKKDGSFHIGVNAPLRTYKSYPGGTVTPGTSEELSVNKKNIYVGFNVNQTYTPTDYQVHWWDKDNASYNNDSSVQSYFSPNKQGNYANSTYNMTYATIPYDANSVRLRKGDNWYGADNNDLNSKNTIIVYSDKGNTNTDYQMSGTAAGLESFYKSANVSKGNTINLAATGQGKITYKSSDNAIATVSTSGVVTGIKSGSVIIEVTSEGAYGDKITAECKLTVVDNSTISNIINDVPVVTNVKVAGATGEGSDRKSTVVSVYWYIKNEGSDTLTYTIDDVYLTL